MYGLGEKIVFQFTISRDRTLIFENSEHYYEVILYKSAKS
jgi:hypothetical protein